MFDLMCSVIDLNCLTGTSVRGLMIERIATKLNIAFLICFTITNTGSDMQLGQWSWLLPSHDQLPPCVV
jgi:hypothetical protein